MLEKYDLPDGLVGGLVLLEEEEQIEDERNAVQQQFDFKADFNGSKAFVSGSNLKEIKGQAAASFEINTPIKLCLKNRNEEYPMTNQKQFETTMRNINIDKSTLLIVRLADGS